MTARDSSFFTVTWEGDIKEFFSTYRRAPGQQSQRPWCWGLCHGKCECLSRAYNHCLFAVLFVLSYLWTMAPALLAVVDTAVAAGLYSLFAPENLEPHAPDWIFRFQRSLLDVVMLTLVRAFAIIVAYGACSDMRNCFRPYKVASMTFAIVSSVYLVGKAWTFQYTAGSYLPAALFIVSAVFAWLHLIEAQRMVTVARRRRRVGLCVGAGLNGPEREWLLEGGRGGGVGSAGDGGGGEDVPAHSLADPDSCFIECDGVSVHYKWAGPPGDDTAVLLLHGFGGGCFSWRHVMAPLAQKAGCRVLAFDRPAFGLTSRPPAGRFPTAANPYTVRAQVRMALSLCESVGIRRVVVVGHGDGALLALLTAEAAVSQLREGGGIGGGGGVGDGGGEGRGGVEVVGMALMDPNLSGDAPSFTGLLLNTRMGRAVLRPLLRSELGEVSNRRAWHDSSKLTPEVLSLYKTPLRVDGWDQALIEFSRQRVQMGTKELREHLEAVAHLPALLVAGGEDNIARPRAAQRLARHLPHSQVLEIPSCGHLPHEECPEELLAALAPFVFSTLAGSAPCGSMSGSPSGLVQRSGSRQEFAAGGSIAEAV